LVLNTPTAVDGVFMTLGDGFHTIDVVLHRRAHIAFKVASYMALREAYACLLDV
jgi:hypothetical protein